MGKINRICKFIEIKKAFVLMAFILIALGFLEQFFLLFLCVTIHELMHVLAAFYFGISVNRVIITPLGETSVMNGIEGLSLVKKMVIVLVGPFSNICMGFAGMIIGLEEFYLINFSIAAFNMLPVYPLDGGRLLRYLLGEIFGFINSYKLSGKIARYSCKLIIIIGFIQVALYPYNISLICAGLYLIGANKIFSPSVYEFYKLKLGFGNILRIRPVTVLAVDLNLPVSILVNRLRESRFYYFAVISDNKIVFLTDEFKLLNYISEHGLNKTIGDLCANTLCKD